MARVRRKRERREQSKGPEQLPFTRVYNPFKPIEPLAPEKLAAIDNAAMTILEEIGLDFLHPEAHEILKQAGADVSSGSDRVRFSRDLIREFVAKAPQSFTLHARNPAHDVGMGGDEVVFAMIASAPNCSDLAKGRRPGTFDDFCKFLKLGQALNAIHVFGGYPVEPVDIPPATRHLNCQQAFVQLTDKAVHAYSLGRIRILDALEIVRIGHGLTEGQLSSAARIISIINTSSPLRLDGPMIEGMIELGKRNQAIVVTPFTLAGAMAPTTIAGALAQQHAEALAGIAFYQMINPGAPCVYGAFTSNVDMKSGAPAFGTPEYFRSTLASGQLARRYNLPFRSSNVNASNAVDAQSAYESMFSLWACALSGSNFIKHAAGWLEGGLCASFEKVVIDCDLIQMLARCFSPIDVDTDNLALDAIREVGPGGHFFGAAHTLERYDKAFYAPMVSDWRNFESWEEAGSPAADANAAARVGDIIKSYERPSLDPAICEELDSFVAKRTEEGGTQGVQ